MFLFFKRAKEPDFPQEQPRGLAIDLVRLFYGTPLQQVSESLAIHVFVEPSDAMITCGVNMSRLQKIISQAVGVLPGRPQFDAGTESINLDDRQRREDHDEPACQSQARLAEGLVGNRNDSLGGGRFSW